MTTVYSSVWDAIEETPEQAEHMKLRAELMRSISRVVHQTQGTQTEKARQLGISQPRLNDLLQGKINRFSLDGLVTLSVHAGLQVSLVAEAETA